MTEEVKIKKPRKPRVVRPKLPKEKTVAQLVDEVAMILQRLVRARAAVYYGRTAIDCVSCGQVDHWTRLQGGHFISRDKIATKIMESNINPQCVSCNKFHGNCGLVLSNYYEWLIAKHGKPYVEWMKAEAKKPVKFVRSEVILMCDQYKAELESLELLLL